MNLLTQVVFCGVVSLSLCLSNDTFSFPDSLYPSLPIEVYDKDNELCQNQTKHLEVGLQNNIQWAYQMWDASAKDASGILEGNTFQLGHFYECVSVQEPIKAKYCLIDVHIISKNNQTVADPYSLDYKPDASIYENVKYTEDPNKIRRDIAHVGICIPSACSPTSTVRSIHNYLNEFHSNADKSYEVALDPADCQLNEKLTLDTKDILFCSTLVILISIVVICTVIDFKCEDNVKTAPSKGKKLLLCFSARENNRDLLKQEPNNPLSVLYGIKLFMMIGILLGHCIENLLTGPIMNFRSIELINRSLHSVAILRGEVMVDVFFAISGILVTYSYLIQSEKRYVNPARSIILRYFRLVPTFAFLTFFYATIYYKLGSGPLWDKIVGTEMRNCQKNWWTNLLLVNNYIDVDHMCILQAWYLACDLHLFVLAIPVHILIRRNHKVGLSVLGVLLGAAILSPFLVTYLGEKGPFYYMFNNYFRTLRHNNVFQTVYVPTHTRAGPYIVGIYFGYLYYRLKSTKFQLSTVQTQFLFFISSILAAACICSGIIFYNPYKPYRLLDGAFYASLHRSAFVIITGGILLVLTHGSLEILRTVLNWHPIVTLGKLTYGTYMTHMAFQLARTGSAKVPVVADIYTWFTYSFMDLILGMTAAYIIFILIENPFGRLMKELLPINNKKKLATASTEILCSTNI